MSFREEQSATRNLNLWRRPRCLAFAPLRLDMTHHSFPLDRESTLPPVGAAGAQTKHGRSPIPPMGDRPKSPDHPKFPDHGPCPRKGARPCAPTGYWAIATDPNSDGDAQSSRPQSSNIPKPGRDWELGMYAALFAGHDADVFAVPAGG